MYEKDNYFQDNPGLNHRVVLGNIIGFFEDIIHTLETSGAK